ncbi:glycosyltransferase 25 family member-like isoform X2 [Pollicipes pollicipes]|nr:glycosyltransferase 25 family member-like isoform X2 [Pollicipes pollicipes]XP_037085407.1 glycosyltransferase 25 family member-like isoform X2 [Pollicipes pollicipes]
MVRLAAAVALVALAMLACADGQRKAPTVMVAILVRNKEPYLPFVLSRLSELHYPKSRMALWLRSDHNQDRSLQVLEAWLAEYGSSYRSVDAVLNATTPPLRSDETSAIHLSPSRYRAVITLKEEALAAARRLWADFVWFLDADVILHDSTVLQRLIDMEKPLVAPMLRSHGAYSNFWAGMDQDFYYKRTERYPVIYKHKEQGCFAVPMIHTCVLADLRLVGSDGLTFVYSKMAVPRGPENDDVITFALSARQAGLEMYICNQEDFGQVPIPLEPPEVVSKERLNIVNMKLETLLEWPPLPVVPALRRFLPPPVEKTTLGFDHVYMIGLARRQDRRQRMLASFDELGIDAEVVEAVDGRQLNDSFLSERGIEMLPDYRDPIRDRQLTFGEIGCFLSHHGVWQDVLAQGHERVIVFEDDVRFQPYFHYQLEQLMDEVEALRLDWDLIYLGRKILHSNEQWVEGARRLVRPDYTYWTLAYALTRRGAAKLVREQPLRKMVAVDEYLPIMFDRHPNAVWMDHFRERSLLAFSASPLLVHPIKYTGEPGYVSDTEDAVTIGACVAGSVDQHTCS